MNTVFSCGSELAGFVLASGLLQGSSKAIQALNDGSTTKIRTSSSSLAYKICDNEKYQILVFGVGVDGEVSSELPSTLVQNPSAFNFLKVENDSFSINEEALTLFGSFSQDENLSQLPRKRLIITGHSIGGWIASLCCLYLLHKMKPSNSNLPICITFGSPLLGDDAFSKAIHIRSGWKSRFLHVVSSGDLIARAFVSSAENSYKPFGTFLICSSSSSSPACACACFDDTVSILQVLAATRESPQILGILDYVKLVEDLTHQIIVSNGVSELWGSRDDPLRAGIILQLEAIGVQSNQNKEDDKLITEMERRERKNYLDHVRRTSEADKKLNDMKINMANLEWYKQVCSTEVAKGYYDCYKNKLFPRDIYAAKFKKALTKFWQEVVNEAATKPLKLGEPPLPMRLLYAGTNYRRMVEPLDIADYYTDGKLGYMTYITNGRSERYKLLEEWMEEHERAAKHRRRLDTRDTAATLTEDSCFYAKLEEAMIWTKSLKYGEAAGALKESLLRQLNKFEEYAMDLIDDLAASLEIFLKDSIFMQWWKEYETIPERNRTSRLANFMDNKRHLKYK